jgi:hypothetical protein
MEFVVWLFLHRVAVAGSPSPRARLAVGSVRRPGELPIVAYVAAVPQASTGGAAPRPHLAHQPRRAPAMAAPWVSR